MKLFSFLLCVLLNACLTNKVAVQTGVDEITFGSGGGFTGEIKIYKLTVDSRLFEKDRELKKIEPKSTLDLFTKAKDLQGYDFNEPDNMYSFVEIKRKEGTQRIVWGGGSLKVDKRAIELHKELLSLINS